MSDGVIPHGNGYSVQMKHGVRGWKWTVRLGARTPHGPDLAKGVAPTEEDALLEAAAAFRRSRRRAKVRA